MSDDGDAVVLLLLLLLWSTTTSVAFNGDPGSTRHRTSYDKMREAEPHGEDAQRGPDAPALILGRMWVIKGGR